MKRSPLYRRSKLRPGKSLRRSCYLRRQSAKQRRKQADWAAVNRDIVQEFGPGCRVRIAGLCWGRATGGHHIKKRSAGGPNTRKNCLRACPSCHDFIETHPAWARENGFSESNRKVLT